MAKEPEEQDATGGLERDFFGPEHAGLLRELKSKTDRAAQRDALRDVVRIHDDKFLDRLITLGIGAEKALTLRLIPLVFVAWADGEVNEREREALLRAAREQGLVVATMSEPLLRGWLANRPDPRLLTQWKESVRRIWNRFTPDEQWKMRQNLLSGARDVAQAAGGFLGLTSGISAGEKAVLADLERALD